MNRRIEELKNLQKQLQAVDPVSDKDLDQKIIVALLPNKRTDLLCYGAPFTSLEGLGHCVALAREMFKTCKIVLDEDPSGCGAELILWEKGLSEPQTMRVKTSGCSINMALLDCIFSALIEQENKKKPEISKEEWDKKVLRLANLLLSITACEDCGSPKIKGHICSSCDET